MKIKSKLKLIIFTFALVVLIGAGVTVSYILVSAPPIENEFEIISVSCLVEREDDETQNISIKNTGDIPAYLRAIVIVNFVSEESGNIHATSPVANVDYSITLGSERWVPGSDGYYYYLDDVTAQTSSEVLISELEEITDAPDGYKLSVTVLAQAVQAEPDKAVQALWGVGVLEDGSLSIP